MSDSARLVHVQMFVLCLYRLLCFAINSKHVLGTEIEVKSASFMNLIKRPHRPMIKKLIKYRYLF